MTETKKNIIDKEHRATGLTSLADNMSPFVKKLLGKKGLVEMELMAQWRQIVGPDLAEYTVPQKLDFKKDHRSGGVLHLAVPDGAFSVEVSQQKPLLLEKINTYFGYQAVADLRLVINDLFFKSLPVKDDDKPKKTLVTETQKNYINQLTEGVQNPDLKNRLQKLGESILKNNN